MGITNKFYIQTKELNKKDPTKSWYHRIGEIVTISKQDGGSFDVIKMYANPNEELYLSQDVRFRDETPSQPETPASYQENPDGLPF